MEEENKCTDNEFSEKISILVVDYDTNCLIITSDLLKKEKHKVVTVKNANDALSILRVSGNSFDLVITNVHMPEMNGFQLQQYITNEFGIPVVFMSDDEIEDTIIKGFESGGAFFILKPITQDDVQYLWQYAIMQRKKKTIGKQVVIQKNNNEKRPDESSSSSSFHEKTYKRNKHDRAEDQQVHKPPKKSKLIWTEYLHNRFLEAITRLGLKRAYPRRILEVMNIPELTRENVASHLQKYRAYLRKVTAPTNNISKLVSNSSRTTFGNANQLATREVTDPIPTQLLNIAPTSAQQFMPENLNFTEGTDHQFVADDTNFQSIERDKEFEDILTRHLNQKHHQMVDNIYLMPNSTVNTTDVFNSQLNVQSSMMENNNIEEGTILSFVDDNNQYQQDCFSWTDRTLAEQESCGDVDAEERSFQFHNAPLNSELEQENYEGVTAQERSFQLHNAPLSLELEQENYEGVTAEERSFQFHNAPLNLELEQENYEGLNAKDRSFHPHI